MKLHNGPCKAVNNSHLISSEKCKRADYRHRQLLICEVWLMAVLLATKKVGLWVLQSLIFTNA